MNHPPPFRRVSVHLEAIGVVHHQHRRLPWLLNGSLGFRVNRHRRHLPLVHAGLKEELLQFRSLFRCRDREFAKRHVVIKVDLELRNGTLTRHRAPGRIGRSRRTDDHVRVTPRFRIPSESQGLGAGGRNAALKPTAVGIGLRQRDAPDRVSARATDSNSQLVDLRSPTAVKIDPKYCNAVVYVPDASRAVGVAGELAASLSDGPGSLQVHFYDKLYNLTREEFLKTIKLKIENYA